LTATPNNHRDKKDQPKDKDENENRSSKWMQGL
jgi:hypothetical protein